MIIARRGHRNARRVDGRVCAVVLLALRFVNHRLRQRGQSWQIASSILAVKATAVESAALFASGIILSCLFQKFNKTAGVCRPAS